MNYTNTNIVDIYTKYYNNIILYVLTVVYIIQYVYFKNDCKYMYYRQLCREIYIYVIGGTLSFKD